MTRYAGIDVGATRLRAAVADDEGTLRERVERRTPSGPDGHAVTDAVVELLREACAGAGVAPTGLAGVGVGSVGPLDVERGAIARWVNREFVGPTPLVDPLRAATAAPVTLVNDATAGIIAERRWGDAPRNAVYLTLSTGVGAGVCVDGHVLAGHHHNAGEVGHVPLAPDGRPCGCGGKGHWEAYAGGRHLTDYARELQSTDGIDTDLELGALSASDLFAAAGEDPLASRVIEELARWNARGAAVIVDAYAPSLLAIGGAVALRNETLVIDPIRARLPDLIPVEAPKVRPSTLGEDAVLRGAVAAAR